MMKFTQRERTILDLLVEGKTNVEIAADLRLSDKTVKNHMSRILDEVGVPRRSGVVAHLLKADIERLRKVIASMYFACKAGYGNDAMSRAVGELGMDFLEDYGRRNGEIGGDE